MAKKKPQGRARERGETRMIGVELSLTLDDALEACANRDRRSKKAVLTIALEEYLTRQGLWPPPESD